MNNSSEDITAILHRLNFELRPDQHRDRFNSVCPCPRRSTEFFFSKCLDYYECETCGEGSDDISTIEEFTTKCRFSNPQDLSPEELAISQQKMFLTQKFLEEMFSQEKYLEKGTILALETARKLAEIAIANNSVNDSCLSANPSNLQEEVTNLLAEYKNRNTEFARLDAIAKKHTNEFYQRFLAATDQVLKRLPIESSTFTITKSETLDWSAYIVIYLNERYLIRSDSIEGYYSCNFLLPSKINLYLMRRDELEADDEGADAEMCAPHQRLGYQEINLEEDCDTITNALSLLWLMDRPSDADHNFQELHGKYI